jgi:hypothetical protein
LNLTLKIDENISESRNWDKILRLFEKAIRNEFKTSDGNKTNYSKIDVNAVLNKNKSKFGASQLHNAVKGEDRYQMYEYDIT